MKVTFWGTRGSIPSPGPHTVKVGGNTTCVEVETGIGHRVIIDSGTGIRPLGLKLVKEKHTEPILLLFTHSHWDHLAGFTFFPPAYIPDFQIDMYGNPMALEVLRRDIFDRRDNRYFPVNMDDFRATIRYIEPLPKPLIIGSLKINSISLNHPGNGYGYRFDLDGKSFAFVTDNEIGLEYAGGNTLGEMTEFCRNCDVLVHDAQYLPSEIEQHKGWGHSTYVEAIELAVHANVKHLVLTHHDPERDDDSIIELLDSAREYILQRGYSLLCELGVEGQSLVL